MECFVAGLCFNQSDLEGYGLLLVVVMQRMVIPGVEDHTAECVTWWLSGVGQAWGGLACTWVVWVYLEIYFVKNIRLNFTMAAVTGL